jgi:hypothetical protein
MQFAANQAAFAEALLDPARAVPEGITTARGQADPSRFAVYRNNVFVGLTAALAKRFPVVERLVGKDFFAGMARVYAGRHKPASPLLFEYGDGFPDFIEQFEPAGGLAYLGDVARLEVLWTRAYHAEDAEPVVPAKLAKLEPSDLARTRFAPHPAAALISSPYPIGSIWAAHQSEIVEPVKVSRPETVLVARPVMDVSVHILPAGDVAFAQALFAGETLGQAAERASALNPCFDFGTAVVGLVSLGAFGAMEQQDEPT